MSVSAVGGSGAGRGQMKATVFDAVNFFDFEETVKWFRMTYVFPLFTELSRTGVLPQLLYCFQMCGFYFELLAVGNWTGSRWVWKNGLSDFGQVLRCMCDWGVTGKGAANCVATYCVSYIIVFMQTFWFVLMLYRYHKTRSFVHWQLLVFNFLNNVLMSLMATCHGCLAAEAFCSMIEVSEGRAVSSVLFVLSMMCWLGTLFCIKVVNEYLSESPVFQISVIATWDSEVLFSSMLIMSMIGFAGRTMDVFPKWGPCLCTVGHIMWAGYEIYLMWFLPMVKPWMNSLIQSVMVMAGLYPSWSFVHVFVDGLHGNTEDMVFIVLPAAVSLSAWPIFQVIFTKKMNRIRGLLMNSAIDMESKTLDATRIAHFDSIVFTSKRDVICHMRVGLTYHCDMVVNFSFLRYIIEFYSYPETVLMAAKVASFFPMELTFLRCALASLGDENRMSRLHGFLAFQLKRVNILRQSSVSPEASQELQMLQKEARESISLVRSFWGEILNAKTNVSFASLRFVRRRLLATDASFKGAIERFPSNAAMMTAHSRFQIEGLGAFSQAVATEKRLIMVGRGKSTMIDYPFRSMVNVFPSYLLDNVVDTHGNIVGMINSNSSMSSIDSSSSSNDDAEIDGRHDEITMTLFDHGKLRLAIEHKMSATKMKSVTSTQALAIVQLLSTIVMLFVIIGICPRISTTVQNMSEFTGTVSDVLSRMFRIVFSTCVESTDITSVFDRYQSFVHYLNSTSILGSATMYRNMIEHAESMFADIMLTVESALVCDTEVFSNQVLEYLRFSDISKSTSIDMALRSGLTYFAFTGYVTLSWRAQELPGMPLEMLYKEILVTGLRIANGFQEVQRSVQTDVIKYAGDSRLIILICTMFLVSACAVVLLSLWGYTQYQLYHDQRICSSVLRNVPASVVKSSYEPIALKFQNEPIRGSSVHSAHGIDLYEIFYVIIVLVTIFGILSAVFVAALTFVNRINNLTNMFSWLHDVTTVFVGIMNSTIALTGASCNFIDEDDAWDIVDNALTNMRSFYNEFNLDLLVTEGGLSSIYYESECDTFGLAYGMPDYTKCLSIHDRLNLAVTTVNTLFLRYKGSSGDMNNANYATLLYTVLDYLPEDFITLRTGIVRIVDESISDAYTLLNTMLIVGVVVAGIAFVLEWAFAVGFSQSVDTVKQLIQLLPPISTLSSSVLTDFIVLGTGRREWNGESLAESVLLGIPYGVIVVDSGLVIQSTNKAVNSQFGYSGSQVLGRGLQWLIHELMNPDDEDDCNLNFYRTIEHMSRPEQSEISHAMPVECTAENGMTVSASASVLCVRDTYGNVQSFVIFIRDTSEEHTDQQKCKEARVRAESLITALLPSTVIKTWSSNRKMHVVHAQTATICAMEIVGLDDMVHTTPADKLMMNLKAVCDRLDSVLSSYPMVRCMKTQEDLFLTVTGLLDRVTDATQVRSTVGFALDAIADMEAFDDDFAVHLKVAIDIGDHVYGRSLNETTPTFDIYGGAVDTALLMRRTSPLNSVRVGERVRQLMDAAEFDIETFESIIDPKTKAKLPTYQVFQKT